MSGEIEALGALATAGLAADALDRPGSAPAPAIVATNENCANCAAPLSGSFCSQCGQKAHLHRSLIDIGHEFLHGLTHFDGKAWNTLPMLLFHPGKLTRDYIMGKRARYIAPVPLFLLVVFLMFFVFSFVTINPGGGATDANGNQLTQAQARKALPGAEAELARLDALIKAATTSPKPAELAGLRGERIGAAAVRDQLKARAAGNVESPKDFTGQIAREIANSDAQVNLGNEGLNAKARAALKNPELVFYKIQGKAYKLSFLLVPMSLPWLWLVFAWKRDVRLYDHAIFALYSISFMSLLFVIGSAALALGLIWEWLWVPLLLAPFAHMYVQLKGAYALSRFSAAWRAVALASAAWITLAIYVVLMIALGVLD